jgi:class 3 adenylate cyclase
MAYTTAEGRRQLLDDLARAIEALGVALAALGAAYDVLDERSGDRLEEQLFRPVQSAAGRARRMYTAFAARYGLATVDFPPASAGPASLGPRGFVERAVDAVAEADEALAELQDSMLPVEVGDPELRAGLAEVRALMGDLRARAREFVRTLGR